MGAWTSANSIHGWTPCTVLYVQLADVEARHQRGEDEED